MTLREEFAVLRGTPIGIYGASPCEESCDKDRICQKPLLSVHMITYNHEKFIARAIEGVLAQKTDFEFELVIGEDCSRDRTREICLEYQRRHPGLIRVLWSDKNVSAVGNFLRVVKHCRGKFIAFCEGDDYWIDPYKLQKQVNVMREHDTVGLCICGARVEYSDTGKSGEWNDAHTVKPGLMPGRSFFLRHLMGSSPYAGIRRDPVTFIVTATAMLRKSVLLSAYEKYEILHWRLTLADTTTWLGVSSIAEVYYLEDVVAVYYRNSGSAMGTIGMRVGMDADLVRMYFFLKALALPLIDMPSRFRQDALLLMLRFQMGGCSRMRCWNYFKAVRALPSLKSFCFSMRAYPALLIGCLFGFGSRSLSVMTRLYAHLGRFHSCSRVVRGLYETNGIRWV